MFRMGENQNNVHNDIYLNVMRVELVTGFGEQSEHLAMHFLQQSLGPFSGSSYKRTDNQYSVCSR